MSTTISPDRPGALAARPVPKGRVTQANVIRSEWTKLWTLRSTRWSLFAAVFLPNAARSVELPLQVGDVALDDDSPVLKTFLELARPSPAPVPAP